MTRVNTIDPENLLNEHLLAEWREIPRIVNELIKHPDRFKKDEIPHDYRLKSGHVKFFRDKLLFIRKRHEVLIKELRKRGVKYDPTVRVELNKLPKHLQEIACNDWIPTERDHKILIGRLKERVKLRKRDYTFSPSPQRKEKLTHEQDYKKYFDYLEQVYIL